VCGSCIGNAGITIRQTRRLPRALGQRGRQKGPKIQLCGLEGDEEEQVKVKKHENEGNTRSCSL